MVDDGRPRRKKRWIQGAVKHPGAATAAAKQEGLSLTDWISKYKHEGGVAGRRARLASKFRKMN